MKKKALIALLSVVILSMAAPSMAHRYKRNTSDNPFRIVGYIAHPIGLALEYGIMRPIHWAVSQHDTDIIFGHGPDVSERGKFYEWTHGNFAPTIAEEVEPGEAAVDAEEARLENKEASDEAAEALREATAASTEADLRDRQRAEARARRQAEREARKAAEAVEAPAEPVAAPAEPAAPAEAPAAPAEAPAAPAEPATP